MTDLVSPQEIQAVSASLTKAWAFLCGAQRAFTFSLPPAVAPSAADFNYFTPLQVHAEQRTGAVGVLIERADALAVAAHMFGLPEADLQEADLQDACAEVCNMFCDSMAVHISGSSDMHIGLPFQADRAAYATITASSSATAVYTSASLHARLHVVVYYFFQPPSVR